MQKAKQGGASEPQKFPHKGRAGWLARKKIAEEQAAVAPAKKDTGWGRVAEWYHETVEDRASYQRDLIMPNLMRLIDIKPGQKILDLGCGEGIFTRRFAKTGAEVTAIDISRELIEIAKRASVDEGEYYKFQPLFFVSDAATIPMVESSSQDVVVITLALQNMERATDVLRECSRVLKSGGQLFITLNHPAFRGIKRSDWSWSEKGDVQYRRVWRYMSESREKIDMTPSTGSGRGPGAQGAGEQTISFNRPLQFYVKHIGKAGMAVVNMEEWVSNKNSLPGPRAAAENIARNEIPLFMCIIIKKM